MRELKLFNETLGEPAQDLALDEALLCEVNAGQVPSLVRFWRPAQTFVALGKGLFPEREVALDACAEHGIPVHKRCSGGGAVVLSPSVLCFSFVLRNDVFPEVRQLRPSYQFFGDLAAGALRALGLPAEILPLSDLACNGRKISGNAQARKRQAVLHHGTFVLQDISDAMELCLRHPSREPDYRRQRRHREFVTSLKNLGFTGTIEDIQAAMCRDFNCEPADATIRAHCRALAVRLAKEKYANFATGMCNAVLLNTRSS